MVSAMTIGMLSPLSTLLMLACTGKGTVGDDSQITGADSAADDSAADDSADDSAADDSGGDTGYPDGLHGDIPAENIPAPEFSATSDAGLGRSRADLMGHRTVLWFFPAAGTFG